MLNLLVKKKLLNYISEKVSEYLLMMINDLFICHGRVNGLLAIRG